MNALKKVTLLLLAIFLSTAAWSQEIHLPEKPMASVDIAALYIPDNILKAARQMPQEYYSFKPTPDVRSFGELIAHIAESNFEMCAIAKGESPPATKVVAGKEEAIKALEKSFAYTMEARKNMTKQQKERVVKFMGGNQPAGNVLDFSIFHSLQHYGNISMYMRMKGLVPPSSQAGDAGNDPVKQVPKK